MADPTRERRISLTLPFHNYDKRYRFDDDGRFTFTSTEQKRVEDLVQDCVDLFNLKATEEPILPTLFREEHCRYLQTGILNLSESYQHLDASRPWIAYWILHSIELLGDQTSPETNNSIVGFLKKCEDHKGGGYGGGPGQYAHLATTYAAVMALCIVGTPESYASIDRPALHKFLLRMKRIGGGFRMCDDGEVDIRGAYCAAVVASLLNLPMDELFDGTPQWIVSCQTYEGGFSAYPYCEAHGGYTFCGLAALILLGHERLCDTKSLLRWVSFKQMRYEGGFQGRTNKLVDGCYSYWQGAVFPLLHEVLHNQVDRSLSIDHWMFDSEAIQNYLLLCCQNPAGGLLDKPEKPRDYYHTCYTLSGLSLAQHFAGGVEGRTFVVGPKSNLLRNHPLFNITEMAAEKAREHFKNQPDNF